MAQDQAAQWGAMLRGVQRSVNRGLPLERTCLLGLLLRVSGGASYRNDVPHGSPSARVARTHATGTEAPGRAVGHARTHATRFRVQRSHCFTNRRVGAERSSIERNHVAVAHGFIESLQAGRHAHATPATRLGACAAWLRLCRPFLGDEKKEANAVASLDYLKSDLGKAAYPDDLTCVNVAPMPSSAPMDVDSDQEMYDV